MFLEYIIFTLSESHFDGKNRVYVFQADVIIDGEEQSIIGSKALIRSRLRRIFNRFGLRIPNIPWKQIIGDPEGNSGTFTLVINEARKAANESI